MCWLDADFLRQEVKSQFCAPSAGQGDLPLWICLPARCRGCVCPPLRLCVYLCGAPPPDTHPLLAEAQLAAGERGRLPALVGRGLCSGGWSCSPHSSDSGAQGMNSLPCPPLLLSPAVSWSPGGQVPGLTVQSFSGDPRNFWVARGTWPGCPGPAGGWEMQEPSGRGGLASDSGHGPSGLDPCEAARGHLPDDARQPSCTAPRPASLTAPCQPSKARTLCGVLLAASRATGLAGTLEGGGLATPHPRKSLGRRRAQEPVLWAGGEAAGSGHRRQGADTEAPALVGALRHLCSLGERGPSPRAGGRRNPRPPSLFPSRRRQMQEALPALCSPPWRPHGQAALPTSELSNRDQPQGPPVSWTPPQGSGTLTRSPGSAPGSFG